MISQWFFQPNVVNYLKTKNLLPPKFVFIRHEIGHVHFPRKINKLTPMEFLIASENEPKICETLERKLKVNKRNRKQFMCGQFVMTFLHKFVIPFISCQNEIQFRNMAPHTYFFNFKKIIYFLLCLAHHNLQQKYW